MIGQIKACTFLFYTKSKSAPTIHAVSSSQNPFLRNNCSSTEMWNSTQKISQWYLKKGPNCNQTKSCFFLTCHGASLTPASSPPIILPSSKQKIEQGNIKINRNFHMIFYVLVNKSYATVNIPLKYVAHQLIDRKIRFMSIVHVQF